MINWLALPALVLALTLYGLTLRHRHWLGRAPLLSAVIAIGAAIPAVSFAIYYLRWFDDPIWLFRLRAMNGSEFLAAALGYSAGWLQVVVMPRLHVGDFTRRWLSPTLLIGTLLLPYAKPVMMPVDLSEATETWHDGVCFQSTGTTCGPASVANVLHHFGMAASEHQLARECYTTERNTECWYMLRALRQRGLKADIIASTLADVPLPAIAGTRLGGADGTGHFIALLSRTGDEFEIIDSIRGKFKVKLPRLAESYYFTGFFMPCSTVGR